MNQKSFANLDIVFLTYNVFNRRFCGNGVPDWVPQPPEFNFPYPMEVEYEVDENGYPSRQIN